MSEVATPNQAEREFETGLDETAKNQSELNQSASAEQDRIIVANKKRTYDLYQDLDIVLARRALVQFESIQNLSLQAMQNSIESANMVAKQAIRHTEMEFGQLKRHSDLAADSYWNPVSAGAGMNLTAGSVPSNRTIDQETAVAGGTVANASAAVASAVAKQVDATITPILATLQQILQTLASASTSIANVVNQTQPKT